MPSLNGEKRTLTNAVFGQLNRHLYVAPLRPQLHDVFGPEPFVDLLLADQEASADQDSTALLARHNNINIARIIACLSDHSP